MGAAGKKEMHSSMRQDSHRAIRFRLHPEQTPWPRYTQRGRAEQSRRLLPNPSIAIPFLDVGLGVAAGGGVRVGFFFGGDPTGRRCYRLPCRSLQDSCCPNYL